MSEKLTPQQITERVITLHATSPCKCTAEGPMDSECVKLRQDTRTRLATGRDPEPTDAPRKIFPRSLSGPVY